MYIDTLTMVVCTALPLLAALAAAANQLWLRPRDAHGESGAMPPLSVIMSVHDNAPELERHLPALLTQDYAPGYEVIVVDESSTDGTEDTLKRLKLQHPNLYTTFIPSTSHYLSRRKLALTVGVKAARNEWLVFTDADCKPRGDQWLKALAAHCTEDNDIVLGYTTYEEGTPARWRFGQLLRQWRALRSARRTAYRHAGHNLALRKSVFLGHDGFLGNLKYLRGEYDFMVNEYATKGRTGIAIEAEAHIVQDRPTKRAWLNDRLYYMETRRHLSRSAAFRLPALLCALLLHTGYVAALATMGLAAATNRWLELGVAALSLLLLHTLRAVAARRALKPLGERLPWAAVPLMELWEAWGHLGLSLRHARADKYDFIRK